jgi:hypothetical protein
MSTEYVERYLARLYLTWLLIAISGIGIVLLLVFLLLDLGDPFSFYEVSQDVLLLLLPVTGYLCGRLRGSFQPA